MSALLMGVNRAYPYAKLELEKISGHIDTMYKVVHIASFNIGVHALTLLYQVSDYANDISDRFYSALYKKLIDPKLFTTTHKAMLLSLVYKALLKDKQLSRVKVFIKRLLQLGLYMQPSFLCGVLYLVSQLIAKRKNCQCFTLKQTSNDSDLQKYDAIIDQDDSEDIKPDINTINLTDALAKCQKKDKPPVKRFDPLSRNPLYAGGEFCVYTELVDLSRHFHPTVALYASNLLQGEPIFF